MLRLQYHKESVILLLLNAFFLHSLLSVFAIRLDSWVATLISKVV